jgi:hypothetical protein
MSIAPNKRFVHTIRLLKRFEVSPPTENGGDTLPSPCLSIHYKHSKHGKRNRLSQFSSIKSKDLTHRFSLAKPRIKTPSQTVRSGSPRTSNKRPLTRAAFAAINLLPLHPATYMGSSLSKAFEGTSSRKDYPLPCWVNRCQYFAVNLTNKRQEA